MDLVKPSEVTPRRSRLGRAFAKVLHIRAVIGVSPDDEIQKAKARDKMKYDSAINPKISFFDAIQDEEMLDKAIKQAFIAKLFASVSSVKAAYAQMQFAQSPYDAEGIQSSDQTIVSELKKLSELKHCYLNNKMNETSPETTLVLAEIQEQRSLLKTYEITCKKLDFQLKLKDSEITFLREKLAEANSDNKLLEKRLNSSGQISMPEVTKLSNLRPSHFIAYHKQVIKSIRSFVGLMIREMEISGWDLDAAARSIEPGITFWRKNHTCFTFESFVCREMFDGFNHPNFSIQAEGRAHKERGRFFDRFLEMKSVRPADYLAWKPKSLFAAFCRVKYLRLVHPKMEEALFGNLDQRDLVSSGGVLLPETPFFSTFIEMAKRVWLLHCLALSFDPEISIFQVGKGNRFSEVYMESLSDEAFFSPAANPRVAFVVVPGFRIGKTILQSLVYLR